MNDATFLFDKVIFGPVKSRRFGISLGVNLLPNDSKLCNFNCIYCECGWTALKGKMKQEFHSRNEVKKSLCETLLQLKSTDVSPDVITFAGNGEPTMHPEFSKIVDDTIEVRNNCFPSAKIAVLTNATMLHKKQVTDALKKADLRILKLDGGTEELFQKINLPNSGRSLNWIVDHLQSFQGDLIVQTMFLKGIHKGSFIDNTTDENVDAWLRLLEKIKPGQVMLYSIDRATAEKCLEKISTNKMEEIATKVRKLGIEAMVS